MRYEKDGGVFGAAAEPRRRLDQRATRPRPRRSRPARGRASSSLAGDPRRRRCACCAPSLDRDPDSLAGAAGAGGSLAGARRRARRARRRAMRALRVDDAEPALARPAGRRARGPRRPRRGRGGLPRAACACAGPRGRAQAPGLSRLLPRRPRAPGAAAQFRIRYDGGVNEPLGRGAGGPDEAYAEYASVSASSPDQPVDVILQIGAGFQEDARAAGVGRRASTTAPSACPLRGLEQPTPRLRPRAAPRAGPLLRRRAHREATARPGCRKESAVAGGRRSRRATTPGWPPRARGGCCPLSPWRDRSRTAARGPAPLAYAESLSAVAHMLRKRGEAGDRRALLSAALADRLPSEEALPVALGPQLSASSRELGSATSRRDGRRLARSPGWLGLACRYQSRVRSQAPLESPRGLVAEQPPGQRDVGQAVAYVSARGRAFARAAAGRPITRDSVGAAALSVTARPVATFTACPRSPLAPEGQQVAVHDVLDVGEVAALPPVAVDHGRLPVEERGDEEADDAAVGRAGSCRGPKTLK